MTYLLLTVLAIVVGGGAFVVWRRPAAQPVERPAVRSLVRVLHDRGELDEALRRAAEFERLVEASLHLRTEHYESMLERARSAAGTSSVPRRRAEALQD